MQARNEILEELRLLSTTISTISRENPYQVPAGYFDGFPAQVLSLTGEVPFFAGNRDKPLTFSVPIGYFEGFAQNLLDRIKAGQPNQIGQPAIPGESAGEELALLSPLLNSITRTAPYQVPDNYFQQLSPMLAPLAGLREKPLYTVPDNYFAGLADEILSRVNPVKMDQPARVISLDRSTSQNNSSRQLSWLKYSVAAAIAGIIITFGWLRLNGPSGHPNQPVEALASVSDQDLQTYAENNNDQATTESMNSTATLDINDSDVKSLLGDVPDGDLKQYMEEHGGAVDIATN